MDCRNSLVLFISLHVWAACYLVVHAKVNYDCYYLKQHWMLTHWHSPFGVIWQLRHDDIRGRNGAARQRAKSLLPFGGIIGRSTASIFRMRNKTLIHSLWIVVTALLLPM